MRASEPRSVTSPTKVILLATTVSCGDLRLSQLWNPTPRHLIDTGQKASSCPLSTRTHMQLLHVIIAAAELVAYASGGGLHEMRCRDRLLQPFASDSPWK